jgi:hypothetical protein
MTATDWRPWPAGHWSSHESLEAQKGTHFEVVLHPSSFDRTSKCLRETQFYPSDPTHINLILELDLSVN